MSFKYKKEATAHCKANGIDPKTIGMTIEAEPVEHCLHSVKLMIEGIVKAIDATEYTVILSGKKNFRDDIYEDYKANRDPTHKPFHYKAIKDYLQIHHPCIISEGIEADDVMGMEQSKDLILHPTELDAETCICTIDKDLNMIAGWHYNWNKDEMYWVEPDQADEFFFQQWLTGDSADNIPGIKGIGEKTAQKILKNSFDNLSRFDTVADKYESKGIPDFDMQRNADLLWIKRTPEGSWRDLI